MASLKEPEATIIENVVCEYTKVTPEQLRDNRKPASVTYARWAIYYLYKQFGVGGDKVCGQRFNRHRSSINYALKTLADEVSVNSKLGLELQELFNLCQTAIKKGKYVSQNGYDTVPIHARDLPGGESASFRDKGRAIGLHD